MSLAETPQTDGLEKTGDEHHLPNNEQVKAWVFHIACFWLLFAHVSRVVSHRWTVKGVLEMVKGLEGKLGPPGTRLAHAGCTLSVVTGLLACVLETGYDEPLDDRGRTFEMARHLLCISAFEIPMRPLKVSN